MANVRNHHQVGTHAALWAATAIAFGARWRGLPPSRLPTPAKASTPRGSTSPSTSQPIGPSSLGEAPAGATVRDPDKPVGTELVSPGTDLNQLPPSISNTQPTTLAPRPELGPTGPARSPLQDAFGDGDIPRSIIEGIVVSPTLAGPR
jgi:hypothetical protein